MKYSENKSDKPVILLTLAAMLTAFVLSGCNSDSVERDEKAEPIYPAPAPAYKYCTSHELVDLRIENEQLAISAERDGEMGAWMLFYIYGPVGGFGSNTEVSPLRLPYAAKLMNSYKRIYDNCKVFSNCVAKDGAYAHPVTEAIFRGGRLNICDEAMAQTQNFISDIYAYSWREQEEPSTLCPKVGEKDERGKTEIIGTSPYIEVVLTKGIESLDTMTDQSNAESFKSELKTLCGHYRQIDYCGLNKKEVYEACEKAFGTNQQ
nr:hypothetical protein HAGR004_00820 [Bdellovibrio sp. HAGR004]